MSWLLRRKLLFIKSDNFYINIYTIKLSKKFMK